MNITPTLKLLLLREKCRKQAARENLPLLTRFYSRHRVKLLASVLPRVVDLFHVSVPYVIISEHFHIVTVFQQVLIPGGFMCYGTSRF